MVVDDDNDDDRRHHHHALPSGETVAELSANLPIRFIGRELTNAAP